MKTAAWTSLGRREAAWKGPDRKGTAPCDSTHEKSWNCYNSKGGSSHQPLQEPGFGGGCRRPEGGADGPVGSRWRWPEATTHTLAVGFVLHAAPAPICQWEKPLSQGGRAGLALPRALAPRPPPGTSEPPPTRSSPPWRELGGNTWGAAQVPGRCGWEGGWARTGRKGARRVLSVTGAAEP